MCGIAGIITRREETARNALPRMVSCQAHRGPNDEGTAYLPFGPRFLGLGHRRLSILDLSPAGHQPMVHPQTGDQIVYNGEVYNFQALRRELEAEGARFAGHSDTEVMLHALSRWGERAIARFEGMYAFAFHDRRRNRLILARDPLGIKPLYVARLDDGLAFASEVRALLASELVPRKLDVRGLAGMLAYGAVQQPCTIVRGIESFPPGHYQCFDADAPSGAGPVRFWNFPDPSEGTSEASAVEAIRDTLDAAVQDHLVSDVPVGVFLSSGLDSTILAGLAARHTPHLRSFTVGFADQPDMSEQALAGRTAELFGLDHMNIDISGPDAEASAAEWLGALDQPSIDGLNVYAISKAVRAHGIAVALSGQGGDELFGGYSSFRDVPRIGRVMEKVRWLPAAARGMAAGVLAAGRSEAVRAKLADIARSDGSILALYLHRRRAMSDAQLAHLGLSPAALGLTPDFLPAAALEDLKLLPDDPTWSVSVLESRYYQGNMLLRDSDVNGMAHSLELRVPILDQRVVNLAARIPGRVRLPDGAAGKHLLRIAFADLLRPELATQAKRGFTLPIRRWMLGPLREMCDQGLRHLESLGVLNTGGVQDVWQAFLRAPETPIWSRAFALSILGLYTRRQNLSL